MIIVGKKDIRKLFVLLSSWNGNNFNYHGKICKHFSMPLNQKPKHFSLPLRLSPPRVILVRMLRRKNIMSTKREVFQAHVAQVQTLQNELESLRAQFANIKGKVFATS